MVGFPDTQVYVQRGSLLNVDGDNSREIRLDFQGADLGALMERGPRCRRRNPAGDSADLSAGVSRASNWTSPNCSSCPTNGGSRARASRGPRSPRRSAPYTGGLWAGEYFDGNDRLDIIVKSDEWHSPEELAELPIVTPGAGVQTVGELTELRQTVGPVAARAHQRPPHRQRELPAAGGHDARRRPSTCCDSEVEPKVRAAMAPKVQLTYAGSVNDLHQALRAMGQNFLLALVILFALMAALFRSVRDSLLVMVVIPVSVAGGILALRVVGLVGFQALDLLTMIGFIILLGLVVNAAILLVDQTRARERNGVPRRQAVAEALETRARPIVLSTLTAVLGMAPLIFMPGLGAEIYRGLAAVVAGGMTVGTLFTWMLMPSLLRLGERRRTGLSCTVGARRRPLTREPA